VTATKAGLSAVAVADSGEIFSRQPGAGNRPLGPEEVYCVYKGRKLLRSFNES
jgi:hypothetical protein